MSVGYNPSKKQPITDVLKIFTKLTEKHLDWGLSLITFPQGYIHQLSKKEISESLFL